MPDLLESQATLDEVADRVVKPLVAEIKNLTQEVKNLAALLDSLQINFSRRP